MLTVVGSKYLRPRKDFQTVEGKLGIRLGFLFVVIVIYRYILLQWQLVSIFTPSLEHFRIALIKRLKCLLSIAVRCRDREICPGARFSKVPKLFGYISGDIILFVSSKRRRLEARNLAIIFISIPFTTYEKTSFTE